MPKGAPPSLRQVSWNSVFEPPMQWNCLGNASRDSGQSLVPVPPHRMNGNTLRIAPPTRVARVIELRKISTYTAEMHAKVARLQIRRRRFAYLNSTLTTW